MNSETAKALPRKIQTGDSGPDPKATQSLATLPVAATNRLLLKRGRSSLGQGSRNSKRGSESMTANFNNATNNNESRVDLNSSSMEMMDSALRSSERPTQLKSSTRLRAMYRQQSTFGMDTVNNSPVSRGNDGAEGDKEKEKPNRTQILDRLTNMRANKSFILQRNKQDALAAQLTQPASPNQQPTTEGANITNRLGQALSSQVTSAMGVPGSTMRRGPRQSVQVGVSGFEAMPQWNAPQFESFAQQNSESLRPPLQFGAAQDPFNRSQRNLSVSMAYHPRNQSLLLPHQEGITPGAPSGTQASLLHPSRHTLQYPASVEQQQMLLPMARTPSSAAPSPDSKKYSVRHLIQKEKQKIKPFDKVALAQPMQVPRFDSSDEMSANEAQADGSCFKTQLLKRSACLRQQWANLKQQYQQLKKRLRRQPPSDDDEKIESPDGSVQRKADAVSDGEPRSASGSKQPPVRMLHKFKHRKSSAFGDIPFIQIDIFNPNKLPFSHLQNSDLNSQDEEEESIKVKNKVMGFVIPQTHWAKISWNILMIFVILFEGFRVPFALGFGRDAMHNWWAYIIVNILFVLDIVINSRTTFFHPNSGEQIKDPKKISAYYLSSFDFILDLTAALPFYLIDELVLSRFTPHNWFEMVKLVKMLRIQWEVTAGNQSEGFKMVMKLLHLFFFLMFYIHITGCVLFYVVSIDKEWQAPQRRFVDDPLSFYRAETITQYIVILNVSIQLLTGNDVFPESNAHIMIVCLLSITGALYTANIFGTITVVVSTLNRKQQKFQEKIDLASSSMANMKLPDDLQDEVKQFMMSTQNNLDSQKELDTFMQMVSPSLRNKVTKHIFLNAISSNPVLSSSQEAIDFLINDVSTLLYMPEDRIISQGEHGESLFLIAKGECSVWVLDHLRRNEQVRQLNQGEYFGEVSILNQTARTATVKSLNYCTMAVLNKKTFFDLCNSFPEIILKMRERALEYDDPWRRFKKKMIEQVDYFKVASREDPFFVEEIHHHLQEEYIDKGTEIVGPEQEINQIIFMVQGIVDLIVIGDDGQERLIDSLQQGDMIAQYSVLCDEPVLFSAVARTNIRILTLDREFFEENREMIDGFDNAIEEAEDFIEENGIPLCDYKKFVTKGSLKQKLFRAKRKAQILQKSVFSSFKNLPEAEPSGSMTKKHSATAKGSGVKMNDFIKKTPRKRTSIMQINTSSFSQSRKKSILETGVKDDVPQRKPTTLGQLAQANRKKRKPQNQRGGRSNFNNNSSLGKGQFDIGKARRKSINPTRILLPRNDSDLPVPKRNVTASFRPNLMGPKTKPPKKKKESWAKRQRVTPSRSSSSSSSNSSSSSSSSSSKSNEVSSSSSGTLSETSSSGTSISRSPLSKTPNITCDMDFTSAAAPFTLQKKAEVTDQEERESSSKRLPSFLPAIHDEDEEEKQEEKKTFSLLPDIHERQDHKSSFFTPQIYVLSEHSHEEDSEKGQPSPQRTADFSSKPPDDQFMNMVTPNFQAKNEKAKAVFKLPENLAGEQDMQKTPTAKPVAKKWFTLQKSQSPIHEESSSVDYSYLGDDHRHARKSQIDSQVGVPNMLAVGTNSTSQNLASVDGNNSFKTNSVVQKQSSYDSNLLNPPPAKRSKTGVINFTPCSPSNRANRNTAMTLNKSRQIKKKLTNRSGQTGGP